MRCRATPLIESCCPVPNLLVNIQNHFGGVGFILEDPLGDSVSQLARLVIELCQGRLIPCGTTPDVIAQADSRRVARPGSPMEHYRTSLAPRTGLPRSTLRKPRAVGFVFC